MREVVTLNLFVALDWGCVHQIASKQLDDLLTFCEVLATAAKAADSPRESLQRVS